MKIDVPRDPKTFLSFMDEVRSLSKGMNWRIGQALFNHLLDVRPLIADALRGSNIDPFYSNSTDSTHYKMAVKFIEMWWNEPIDKEIVPIA